MTRYGHGRFMEFRNNEGWRRKVKERQESSEILKLGQGCSLMVNDGQVWSRMIKDEQGCLKMVKEDQI